MYDLLDKAEALGNEKTKIIVKWSKIKDKGKPSYKQILWPQFLLQISGSGLIAPSGMFLMPDIQNYILEILLMRGSRMFLNQKGIGK